MLFTIGLKFIGDSKSRITLIWHYWFKSISNFAEAVDFAYWLGCTGKGLRLQPAQPAGLQVQSLPLLCLQLQSLHLLSFKVSLFCYTLDGQNYHL